MRNLLCELGNVSDSPWRKNGRDESEKPGLRLGRTRREVGRGDGAGCRYGGLRLYGLNHLRILMEKKVKTNSEKHRCV